MASSIFLNLSGGQAFVGQQVGPAASNVSVPPFSFLGDTTSGYGSSAVGTLSLVTAGTTQLSINSTAAAFSVPIALATATVINDTAGLGILALVSSGATNGWRVPNGSNLEYGGFAWASNFLNVGTVTNGGTARTTRLISASASVLISPGGNDNWVFGVSGLTTAAGLTSVGRGLPVTVQNQRTLATVNATSTLTAFTVGAADGTFLVSANVNVTAVSASAMTVTCTYTDETNTSRVATFQFEQNGTATYISSITNVTGTGAYASSPLFIQCKAATTITIASAGTVTGITYNLGGLTQQLV